MTEFDSFNINFNKNLVCFETQLSLFSFALHKPKKTMIEPNFVAIGKIPGECIFVHKDDVSLLSNEENNSKIKCIAIDFRSRRTSVPVRIDYLLSVCPHDPVTSEEEREAINEMVRKILPEKKIIYLNKKFEKIKIKELIKLK